VAINHGIRADGDGGVQLCPMLNNGSGMDRHLVWFKV
jgi:hypothetical protein